MQRLAARSGIFLLFLCMVCPVHAAAGDTDSFPKFLRLEDAVILAVHEHPEIDAAGATADMAEEKKIQARGGFFPRLDWVQSFNRTTNPMWAFGTRLNQEKIQAADFNPDRLNDPDPIDNFSSVLSLSWPIYDSGRTWFEWQQAKTGIRTAALRLDRTRQQIAAAAMEAYLGLLLARKHLALIEKTLETAEAHRRMTQSRFDQGLAVKSDLLLAGVRIAELEQKRLHARTRLEISHSYLNAAMGVPEETRYELITPLESGAAVKGSPETWVDQAIENRLDLTALIHRQQIAAVEIRKRRAAHFPSLHLVGNYEFDSERLDGGGENYTVGAVLQFNLFSGNRLSSQAREAQAEWAEIRARRRGLETGVRVETREACLNCQSAWARIAVANAAIDQAAEALRIVQDRYQNGLATVVDLLNAESFLHAASTRHFHAIHDFRVAAIRLELAAGTLEIPVQ
jgi:outer membrane protein